MPTTTPSEQTPTSAIPNSSLALLKKWAPLIILALSLGIIIIDTTILNVSLRYIIADLNTDIQSLQWVISAYSLTLAALTITGGRLGDFFGRKRMFLVGAALFALGSFVASISTSVGMLLAGEAIIEGVGAALMMPATASLLLTTYQGRDRALAFGVWGGVAGAASAIGPIVGGFLTKNFDWRWGFRINLFVVAVVLLCSFVIKESRDKQEKARIDFVGVGLSALGLLAIVYSFIEASTYGWWEMKKDFIIDDLIIWGGHVSFVPFLILLGLLILALFAWWENRVESQGQTPLVSLGLFKNRQFTTGVLTMTVMSLGMTGLFFTLPVFWQGVKGYDALQTGLVGLPTSIALVIVSPLGAVISHKISPKLMIQTGLVLTTIAVWWLRWTFTPETTWYQAAGPLALFGTGMGLVMSQISNLTLSAVSPQQAGEAAGVNSTMRNVGGAFGAAILGAVLLSVVSTQVGNRIADSKVLPESAKPQIAAAAAQQGSAIEFGGGESKTDSSLPPQVAAEMTKIAHQATVDGIRASLFYTALFILLAFATSFLLPATQKVETEQPASSA